MRSLNTVKLADVFNKNEGERKRLSTVSKVNKFVNSALHAFYV